MADYKDYVDFDVPEFLKDGLNVSYPDGSQSVAIFETLDDTLLEKTQNSLAEMASTPEGSEIIDQLAAQNPQGKIYALSSPDVPTSVLRLQNGTTFVVIDDSIADFKVATQDHDGFEDMSIQRALFHELGGHAIGTPENNHLDEEKRAITATNTYMERYYGEAQRSLDPTRGEFYGSPEWDYNDNFLGPETPAAVEWRQQISSLTDAQASLLGDDIQRLHQQKDDPVGFSSTLRDIADKDGLIEIDTILDQTAPLPEMDPSSELENTQTLKPLPALTPLSP